MLKKIIFATVELITIGGGAALFVSNTLRSSFSFYNADEAGIGAFMIVLGLLVRVWKKEFFEVFEKSASGKDDNEVVKAEKTPSNSLVTGLIIIFAFTFWGFSNRAAVKNKSEISSVEQEVDAIKNSIDMIKKDVDYIDSKSHRHTYSY